MYSTLGLATVGEPAPPAGLKGLGKGPRTTGRSGHTPDSPGCNGVLANRREELKDSTLTSPLLSSATQPGPSIGVPKSESRAHGVHKSDPRRAAFQGKEKGDEETEGQMETHAQQG